MACHERYRGADTATINANVGYKKQKVIFIRCFNAGLCSTDSILPKYVSSRSSHVNSPDYIVTCFIFFLTEWPVPRKTVNII